MRLFTVLLLLPLVLAGTFGLYYMNVQHGDLNQDEGWYLYAAGEVLDGHLPYRDYAFTQGPVLPLVYSIAYPLVEKYGVLGGRMITAMLGLAATLFAALAGFRLAPRGTRLGVFLLVFMFLGLNVYHSYFTMVVKTYSICAAALAAGCYLLTFARGKGGRVCTGVAGFLLAAAASARISSGIALAVVGLTLLLRWKQFPRLSWLYFGVGGLFGILLLNLPFLVMAPEGYLFGMFKYHTLRSPTTDLFALLSYKIGFVSRFIQSYFIPSAAAAGLFLLYLLVRVPKVPADPQEAWKKILHGCFWLIGIAISLVHFTAPFPYDDYQVLAVPILACALALSLGRVLHRFGNASEAHDEDPGDAFEDRRPLRKKALLSDWVVVSLFVLSIASAGSSRINQEWFIYGRDRIWWPVKEQSAIQKLKEAAAEVKKLSGGNPLLLTQDTYLAVEAGMKVPQGLEMGPFSYYPGLTREQAAAYKVVNTDMLEEILLNSDARVAALSGYGLTLELPDVVELPKDQQEALRKILRTRYRYRTTIEKFGQGHTDLMIYVKKPEPAAPPASPKRKPRVKTPPAAEPPVEKDTSSSAQDKTDIQEESAEEALVVKEPEENPEPEMNH